jgi:hypothetical protein
MSNGSEPDHGAGGGRRSGWRILGQCVTMAGGTTHVSSGLLVPGSRSLGKASLDVGTKEV